MMIDELEKALVEKKDNLESVHSRSQKFVRRWLSSKRKMMKEYG